MCYHRVSFHLSLFTLCGDSFVAFDGKLTNFIVLASFQMMATVSNESLDGEIFCRAFFLNREKTFSEDYIIFYTPGLNMNFSESDSNMNFSRRIVFLAAYTMFIQD